MKQQPGSEVVFKYLPMVEVVFEIILVTGVVINSMDFDAMQIVAIALTGLGTVFFLRAFQPAVLPPKEDGEPTEFRELLLYSIAPKICGIASSVTIVGIMFYLLVLPGGYEMLKMGIVALLPALLLFSYGLVSNAAISKALLPTLYRTGTVAGFGIYFILQINA